MDHGLDTAHWRSRPKSHSVLWRLRYRLANLRKINLTERSYPWWPASRWTAASGRNRSFSRSSTDRNLHENDTKLRRKNQSHPAIREALKSRKGRLLQLALALISCAALACPAAVFAGLSERSFVGNFIGYGAQPENYFSISGATDRAGSSGAIYLEKTLSSESSLSIFAGLQRLEQDGESETGWNNLDLAYKHVLVSLDRQEFVFSISPNLEIPTGNSTVSAETHVREGIELLFAKGFGDLPEYVGGLRPLAIEGDVSWQGKLTGARDDLVAADAEVEYSFDYLDAQVARSGFSHALRNFTPNLDFDYSQYMDAHRNSTAPSFLLTPAIAWLNSTFAVNLGAQIALNRAAAGEGAVTFVWQVGVSYDQLVPALGWNPFHQPGT